MNPDVLVVEGCLATCTPSSNGAPPLPVRSSSGMANCGSFCRPPRSDRPRPSSAPPWHGAFRVFPCSQVRPGEPGAGTLAAIGRRRSPSSQPALSGALIAFRRDAWTAIGPFDEALPPLLRGDRLARAAARGGRAGVSMFRRRGPGTSTPSRASRSPPPPPGSPRRRRGSAGGVTAALSPRCWGTSSAAVARRGRRPRRSTDPCPPCHRPRQRGTGSRSRRRPRASPPPPSASPHRRRPGSSRTDAWRRWRPAPTGCGPSTRGAASRPPAPWSAEPRLDRARSDRDPRLAAGRRGAILAGFRAAFGVERSLEEWHWSFPPFADGRSVEVAFDAEGQLIAHYAAIPVGFQRAGRPLLAGQVVDVFTRRKAGLFRRRGLLTRTIESFLARCSGPGRLELLYGFPSLRAAALGRATEVYPAEAAVLRLRAARRAPACASRLAAPPRAGLESHEPRPALAAAAWALPALGGPRRGLVPAPLRAAAPPRLSSARRAPCRPDARVGSARRRRRALALGRSGLGRRRRGRSAAARRRDARTRRATRARRGRALAHGRPLAGAALLQRGWSAEEHPEVRLIALSFVPDLAAPRHRRTALRHAGRLRPGLTRAVRAARMSR